MVDFLVKGLVSFVHKGLRMIVCLRGPISEVSERKFETDGSFARIWAMLLDIAKNFEGNILYYCGKVSVAIDALSRKLASEPLRELCLWMATFTPLFGLLEKVQDVEILDENAKMRKF